MNHIFLQPFINNLTSQLRFHRPLLRAYFKSSLYRFTKRLLFAELSLRLIDTKEYRDLVQHSILEFH